MHIFELGGNRSINDSGIIIQHSVPITHICLSQVGPPSDRQLAVVDRNKDLFLVPVRGTNKVFSKIGTYYYVLSSL